MGKIKYIGCKIAGCDGAHRSQGYCRKHYRQWIGEGKKRYEKVRNNPRLLSVVREAVNRYRKTDKYRESKKKSDSKYYEKNKKIILAYKKGWNEKKRFGTNRESVLWRDNRECVLCENTEDLVIHHKNGQGRGANDPDNRPENLVTLCRKCHMKIHNPFHLKQI